MFYVLWPLWHWYRFCVCVVRQQGAPILWMLQPFINTIITIKVMIIIVIIIIVVCVIVIWLLCCCRLCLVLCFLVLYFLCWLVVVVVVVVVFVLFHMTARRCVCDDDWLCWRPWVCLATFQLSAARLASSSSSSWFSMWVDSTHTCMVWWQWLCVCMCVCARTLGWVNVCVCVFFLNEIILQFSHPLPTLLGHQNRTRFELNENVFNPWSSEETYEWFRSMSKSPVSRNSRLYIGWLS